MKLPRFDPEKINVEWGEPPKKPLVQRVIERLLPAKREDKQG